MAQSNLAENQLTAIESAILEYAEYHQKMKALEKAQSALRETILMMMPAIPEDAKESKVEVDGHSATLAYSTKTIVDARRLYKLDKDLFWRLVNVPVTAAKENVGPDVFHAITSVEVGEPRLTIK